MEFTLRFFKLFLTGLYLTAPMLSIFVCIIVALGQVVGKLERWKAFDAFYWSFVTATTVGYGDIRPTGKTAKSLSIVIAFIGLILTGIVIALALQSASLSFGLSSEFNDVKEQLKQLQ